MFAFDSGLSWEPRRYRQGDEQQIVDLLKTVFEKRYEDSYWQWMYRDHPADADPIIWVAEADGEIVGHYALVPVIMRIDGRRILGSQSGDTATHPRFRGRGLFQTLAKLSYSDADSKGISVTYGFSEVGKPAYVGFVERLGWKQVAIMLSGVKVLNYTGLLSTYLKNRLLKGQTFCEKATGLRMTSWEQKISPYHVSLLNRFDGRFDKVPDLFPLRGHIAVERSSKYLNWRYVTRPGSAYIKLGCFLEDTLSGYLTLKLRVIAGRADARIVDLVGEDEKTTLALIQAVCDLLHGTVDTLSILIQDQNPCIKVLRTAGFRFKKSSLPLIIRANPSAAVPYDQLVKPERWFVTHGDSDQI